MEDVYGYKLKYADGRDMSLRDLRGHVLLIVNTATHCGFTPQYKWMQEIYNMYSKQNFEIIDIPCDQFGGQAPGTNEEITEFCQLHYKTTFRQMLKSDVNGKNALPLYEFLKLQKGFEGFGEGKEAKMMDEFIKKIDPDYKNNPDIKWNFTKFIITRMGTVFARFEPTASLEDVNKALIKCL